MDLNQLNPSSPRPAKTPIKSNSHSAASRRNWPLPARTCLRLFTRTGPRAPAQTNRRELRKQSKLTGPSLARLILMVGRGEDTAPTYLWGIIPHSPVWLVAQYFRHKNSNPNRFL